jgi:hypothetical protein
MPQEEKPIFTVDASGEVVVLRIDGRASYLTSAPVNSLFGRLFDQGKGRFLVDFANCTGMDSTFLGILAGAAMRIKREFPDGFLKLARLNTRNLELVRNLGLHRILEIDLEAKECPPEASKPDSQFEAIGSNPVESQSMLEAHRNLIEADEENSARFEDVIKFLEKEV